jgi:hypothetical protein
MVERRFARHRGLFWLAALVGLVAVVGGGTYAYFGYSSVSGPDGAVRGYFAALARGDARAALAYGQVPTGSRALLTSDVLRAQQRLAPLRHTHVLGVAQSGHSAAVSVTYQLMFASGPQQVNATVDAVERNGSWRLAATAVATRLELEQAGERATLDGVAVPAGRALIFPGAVPIRFDSPYLQLQSGTESVRFGGRAVTELSVQVTADGRSAIAHRLAQELDRCVGPSARAGSPCPLPSGRVVPGSLSGALGTVSATDLHFAVDSDPSGVILVSGTVSFHGTFQQLTFDNVPVVRRGELKLPVTAYAYAVTPLDVRFRSTS